MFITKDLLGGEEQWNTPEFFIAAAESHDE